MRKKLFSLINENIHIFYLWYLLIFKSYFLIIAVLLINNINVKLLMLSYQNTLKIEQENDVMMTSFSCSIFSVAFIMTWISIIIFCF